MAAFPPTKVRALSAAGLLALSACTERPPAMGPTASNPPPGRYVVVELSGLGEVIEIDTATGKTWRLVSFTPEDGGGVSGWEPIRDLAAPWEAAR
jgi:hypothetical protein